MTDDQLDMFAGDVEPMIVERAAFSVPPTIVNVMARFLAGIMFPGAGKYENLPASKRKTAEHAAQAAVDVFANHHDQEGTNG